MEELTLTTPALLFSAVSLILLAYTNRFLSYAQLVRQLRDRYMENPTDITVAQIENLRKRLNLTRTMQGLRKGKRNSSAISGELCFEYYIFIIRRYDSFYAIRHDMTRQGIMTVNRLPLPASD